MGTLAAFFDQIEGTDSDSSTECSPSSTSSGCSSSSTRTRRSSSGKSVYVISESGQSRLRKPSTHRIRKRRKIFSRAFHAIRDSALCRRNVPEGNNYGLYLQTRMLDSVIPDKNKQEMQYKLGDVIGKGSYATVRLGIELNTGKLLAVKQMRISDASDDKVVQSMRREITILNGVQHPNLVCYLGAQRRGKLFEIVLEYCDGNSVAHLLRQFGAFRESLVRHFAAGIFAGVAYLHERRIIHGDIKGANCLVTHDGCVKLADFGCSKKLQGQTGRTMRDKSLKKIRGSVPWMAPEVARGDGYKTSADIWSAGATVLEMFLGRPWLQSSSMAAALKVGDLETPPEAPPKASSTAKNFVSRCLVIQPTKRATARSLVRHVFLCNNVVKSTRDITLNRDALCQSSFGLMAEQNVAAGPKRPEDRTPRRWFCKKKGLFFNWRQQSGCPDDTPNSI